MALGKHQEELGILEAIDYLSSMAEVDAYPEETPSKVVKVNWLDPNQISEHQEVVKQTFKVIHKYLEDLYDKNKLLLQEPETQRGIQAIMVLAKEAAQKLDKYTGLFKEVHGKEGVSRLKEYQVLQHFYLNKIMQKFQESLEKEQSWKETIKEAEAGVLDHQKKELKDLEMVRRDEHYELFLIKNESGFPYFNRNLLAHIKLVGEFDRFLTAFETEDPFLRFREIQDHDVYEGAKEILDLARPHIDEFYKEGMHLKDKALVSSINKALMALMLTASANNLLENVQGKSCLSFYADFHFYLREAISSPAYSRLIAFPPDPSDNFSHMLMNLAHALCCFFFFRIPHDKTTMEFIHKLIDKKPQKISGPQMWEAFLSDDEQLRRKLKDFPNGPILKTLDFFQKDEVKDGFDPIKQENYPLQLFNFFQENYHITLLRIPCPTKQLLVNQAEIIPEFKGLLRYFVETNVKHLLINLQDRTDPLGEQARSFALENLQYDPEFSTNLIVITLPKHTDFYLQLNRYENQSSAAEFLQLFKEQFLNPEASGFFFPESIKIGQLQEWIANAMQQVHKSIFNSSEILSQKQRLCFIEIFYQFFLLKIVENMNCGSMSFISKDALDTGAAASACFFSFLRLMADSRPWSEEEKDFVLWMFYYFSLMVRERAIDSHHFNRVITALAALHYKLQEDRNEIINNFSRFYNDFDFNKIKIQRS